MTRGHKLKFEYETFQTKITNEATGSVTNENFTSNDEPVNSITHGYGTPREPPNPSRTTKAASVTSVTDGNGHTTTYEYDSAGDRTSMADPTATKRNGHTTQRTT